ncbi:MAG TPA: aspartate kinase [Anaerolineae bacterium]|nr:aspartate kinase [Anaerolineae bacterium]HOQ98439.1 aspartate kinase [Anaerolineae bacterium]HPL26722.1 aspartate kinase [Anaerolineae bacterium]
MLIMKFGGSSLSDARCVAQVAALVAQARATDPELVVVVSAMAGATNALFAAARAACSNREAARERLEALRARHEEAARALLQTPQELEAALSTLAGHIDDVARYCDSIATLGEASVRTLDLVAGAGERLSSTLLAARLREAGVAAEAVPATELIVSDAHFGAAEPVLEASRPRVQARLWPLVRRGAVPVVTGYIAATADGVPTTLGRGGSDFTAAILGACLDAGAVWIWTDVDGILTADPNIVAEARTLAELSYADAATLAAFGAEVLHPKTVAPLVERGIPLQLLNTFHPTHPGTRIVRQPALDGPRPPAIISTRGLRLLEVAGNGGCWTTAVAGRALSALAGASVEVLMFSQSFSERTLSLLVRQSEAEASLAALEREFSDDLARGLLAEVTCLSQVGTISVVGGAGRDGATLVPKTFAALGRLDAQIVSVAQSVSEYHVSVVVPEEQVDDTVRFIHRELNT